MKFFLITLCFILLCFCSGSKRQRSSSGSQDLLAITLLTGTFINVPDEILQHILDFLPLKYQLPFSFVNSFWFKKFIFFREKNLERSRNTFLRMTSSPSKVPFQQLLQVIDCFTDYWESLCRNSKDVNFLNQRPQLEISLGEWLSANANEDEIRLHEWNAPLNEEGDTLNYILLQRLLLSPYFLLAVQHPIWDAIKDETKVRAGRDFLLQAPIILGKAALRYLFRHTGMFRRLWRVAIKRGIEMETISYNNILISRNVVLQKLLLLEDIRDDVRHLGHIGIQDHVLKLESIILTAVEAGSIDTFKDGFVGKAIMLNSANYNVVKERLISSGFELAYTCPYKGREMYNMPILSFVNMKNPAFLPFLFWKILNSQTPNQPQILMYLCFSIPNDFDFHQINVARIVIMLTPIISEFLPRNTLENFYQETQEIQETQINIFKDIIKPGIDWLVSSLRAESVKESLVCIDQELKNAALFFSSAPPTFPFLYHPASWTFTWQDLKIPKEVNIKNNIGLYFLVKIGFINDSRSSPVSCGQAILPSNFKPAFSPCQPRKVTLPDGSEVSVFCQGTRAEQVRFSEESSDSGSDSDSSYGY